MSVRERQPVRFTTFDHAGQFNESCPLENGIVDSVISRTVIGNKPSEFDIAFTTHFCRKIRHWSDIVLCFLLLVIRNVHYE